MNAPYIEMFDNKISALAFGDLEIISDFFWVFRNQGVMKRGEMQKKFSMFGPIARLSVLYRTNKGSLSGVTPRMASNFGKR